MPLAFIIETFQWLSDWDNILIVLKVLFGLNLVIFVHELGHFAVAKWCGVKCDKFYIWFDPPMKLGWGKYAIRLPSRIFKIQWGETEYGIGVIPLGGYVKMLGQDDNPSRAAEAVRQARLHADAANGDMNSAAEKTAAAARNDAPPGEPPVSADEMKEYVFDPRSYMAKSVPQRMAIISAGVIMNIIFAVIFASIAYGLGVPHEPPVVGETSVGGAAWQADMQSGDRVLQIGDEKIDKFIELRSTVTALTSDDIAEGVDVHVSRDGAERELSMRPKQVRKIAYLGITPNRSLTLLDLKKIERHVRPDSAAANAGFQPGDEIVSIDGKAVSNYREYLAEMTRRRADSVDIVVRRPDKTKPESTDGSPPPSTLETIKTPPQPVRDLGVRLKFGEITAIKDGSPAAAEDVRIGDRIKSIDGKPADAVDPLLWQLAVEKDPAAKVTLTLERNNKKITLTPNANTIRDDFYSLESSASNSPLGIAFAIELEVTGVESGRPAEGKLRPGDKIVKAQLIAVDDEARDGEIERNGKAGVDKPADFTSDKDKRTWAWLFQRCQTARDDTKVQLTVRRGDATEEITLPLDERKDYFLADRGIVLDIEQEIITAESFGEAVNLGAKETWFALGAVGRFLRKIWNDPQAGENLGSVLTIAAAAGSQAKQGWAELLVFMTLISANLAVINFLPIPVLDGGHMVFLAYEGIRGKPADERIFGILTMIGFVLLLSLMVFVFWLDIQRFFL